LSAATKNNQTVNQASLSTIFLMGTGPATLDREVEFVTKICGKNS